MAGMQAFVGVDTLPWLIALPLIFASASFLLGPRAARAIAPAGLVIGLLAAVVLAWQVAAGGSQRQALGGWAPPLGIELYADGLTALMLLMTAVVVLPVGLYARVYFERQPGVAGFWPLTWFLIGAMNALYLSADIFNLYVTLELLGLAAVGLIILTGGVQTIAAGMRYLLAALAGSLLYLLGVALLYGAHGTLAIALLAPLLAPAPYAGLAAALMVVGLLVKSALFPLHFWLPPAHGGAAAPVSALLSALVIKASFYLLLRLWLDLFGTISTAAAGQLLGWLGAAAILWGSVLALRQEKLKMLVAYSTVAQIGYLFLLFPLVTHTGAGAATSALAGGVMQALSHAAAKSAMFLAVGNMILSSARDDIASIDGLSARHPTSLFAFAMAGVSLMGLPPSGGFVAKWLLLQAALVAGQWWWIGVIIGGGLLTAAYVLQVLRCAFMPAPRGKIFQPVPRTLEFSALALAVVSLALGFVATGPLALLTGHRS
ncbi:MAG: proton-conducting transporter membrane subunit [Burkholderiaceae bacterium]|nr:proton-conducting transporter membrane subunit [Burkholderiaceae bacterium]MDH3459602.1 proton-conducting transporter membrane subunit [Burkholderiaceae bacterium]